MDAKTGSQSLEHAISNAALQKLAKKTPAEFLREFKEQGIGSLEDLVNKTLESVRALAQSGNVAFSDEIIGVCYKFTSYRPHFDQAALGQVINEINQKLIR
jgi:hypothetical protein